MQTRVQMQHFACVHLLLSCQDARPTSAPAASSVMQTYAVLGLVREHELVCTGGLACVQQKHSLYVISMARACQVK